MSVQPGYDPKAADRYHSFRAGFRDCIALKPRDMRFIQHPSRPDMALAYNDGYNAGGDAYDKAMNRASRKYKSTPSILRRATKEPRHAK